MDRQPQRKIIKLLGKKIGKVFVELGKKSLDMTPKAQSINREGEGERGVVNKLEFHQNLKLLLCKRPVKRVKRQATSTLWSTHVILPNNKNSLMHQLGRLSRASC